MNKLLKSLLIAVFGLSIANGALAEDVFYDTAKYYYNKQDYQQAFEYFKKAAEQGNSDAMFHIGNMYGLGQGVKPNNQQELKWYKKAAAQGNAYALFNLGSMYYGGRGVKRNVQKAKEYFRLVCNNNDVDPRVC